MLKRLAQYIHRFSSVYLTSLPGNYTKKKVAILTEFYQLTNSFLNDLDIEYWISYGTLLGHHREEGILSHDIDIDYSALGESFDKIWKNRHLLPKEISIYNTSHNHKGPKVFFSYKGFDGDIYFYEKQDKELIPYLISSIPADVLPLPKKMIFPLQKVYFLNQSTMIPNQVVEYLELCYGYIGAGASFDKKTGYWYKK